jgi:hypothetical protein
MRESPYAVAAFNKGSSTYRAKRYRERADQLRSIAQDLVLNDLQPVLMKLARSYEDMAAAAERSEMARQ